MKNLAPAKPVTQAAFSLVETAIAAGIVSFALFPLLGLMGIITSNSRDLRDQASAMAFVEAISHTLQRDSQSTTQFTWHFHNRKESAVIDYPTDSNPETTTYFVGDETGLIVRPATSAEYMAGLTAGLLSEVYIIRATLRRLSAGMSQEAGAGPGIDMEISIETPVNMPQAQRSKDSSKTRLL